MAEEYSELCPICGNKFDVNGTMAKCPVCGWTDSVKSLEKKERRGMDADSEIAVYRLMSSADAFFSKKSYDEAYISYGSVLDMDGSCLKAVFRRELTSQYLMMESSSVYLSCDSFFEGMKDIKSRVTAEADEKFSMTVFKDMLDYISARAQYEKKYASVHKNEKTAASYLADTLLLFEHTAEMVKFLFGKNDVKNEKERSRLIIDGCALGMKIRGMLLSGAEYVESPGKMEDIGGARSAKNVSRIRRMKLDQKDEIAAERDSAEEDKQRAEYEMWRRRNEKEYIAADRRIIIFDIAAKAALLMAVIMALVFAFELIVTSSLMGQLIAAAVLFTAANITFRILRKAAVKKKGFYAGVIEGDSAGLRSKGGNFNE